MIKIIGLLGSERLRKRFKIGSNDFQQYYSGEGVVRGLKCGCNFTI
jgi:hypothetical protein